MTSDLCSLWPAGWAGGCVITYGGQNERSGGHAQESQTIATRESLSTKRTGT